MKKILVVYYSRTGITKTLALYISHILGADVEEIIDMKKRSGVVGYITADRDAALKRQTKIQKVMHDPTAYDIVYIGTPVRDFTISAAIRTYLTSYEKQLPASLVFFCTQASSGSEGAFQEMASIVGKTPISTIACTNKEISRDAYQEYIKKQLKGIGLLTE